MKMQSRRKITGKNQIIHMRNQFELMNRNFSIFIF